VIVCLTADAQDLAAVPYAAGFCAVDAVHYFFLLSWACSFFRNANPSCKISWSMLRSAYIFFSRAFSDSNCLRCRFISSFMSACSLRYLYRVATLIWCSRQTTSIPVPESTLANIASRSVSLNLLFFITTLLLLKDNLFYL
jgi:hypothetical protein